MSEWTPAEIGILWLSLKVACVAVIASAIPAVGVAWVLARGRFWGRSWLNVLVHLPLVVPPVVTGYALLRVFGRRGVVGAWFEQSLGLQFSFRWTGAALAAAVMAFPLIVRAMRLGIESVDRQVEDAAETLGARPAWVFATVTLPMALPGIVAGLAIGFAKALGEFGATQTLALAIYTQLERPGGEVGALRLAWLSVAISIVALFFSELLSRSFRRQAT
jgi:molybdate transport system permease protein